MNSNTSGLFCAVGAAGVGPGDEVIVSPYTMSASAVAPLVFNAVPVFADIDPQSYCLSAETIRPRITPRTKAIIVVHIFGNVADMDPIMALAARAADHLARNFARIAPQASVASFLAPPLPKPGRPSRDAARATPAPAWQALEWTEDRAARFAAIGDALIPAVEGLPAAGGLTVARGSIRPELRGVSGKISSSSSTKCAPATALTRACGRQP